MSSKNNAHTPKTHETYRYDVEFIKYFNNFTLATIKHINVCQ